MESESVLNWRKRALRREDKPESVKMKVFTKLKRLEEEIPKLKAQRREEAMETYRELLLLLEDKPLFLARYE